MKNCNNNSLKYSLITLGNILKTYKIIVANYLSKRFQMIFTSKSTNKL